MGGVDEHGGRIGDWMGPTGSVGDAGGFSFPGADKSDVGEQKGGRSRSGLVERMAARAGYNAPLRLNTDICTQPQPQPQPPYLSISPGLSPTSFLDSPVFLSNSLVQPSPTTGKFPFAPNANANADARSSMMFSDSDNLFNTWSFAFKPPDHVNPWQSENKTSLHLNSNLPTEKKAEINNFTSQLRPPFGAGNASVEQSGPLDEDAAGDNNNSNSGPCEDGYNWRKYGQKQVKGSEYPRSYYKCTHPNCPVKKKVERSHEGHITEIIYKGAHSHPKPPPSRRSGMGEDDVWTSNDGSNVEVTSSTMVLHGTQFESSDAVDASATFSNDDDEEEEDDHGSVSLGYDGEGDESESKRRKVEAYAAADVSGGSRAIREPRVVVQTTSEVDILDDGYRWRKYGQKVVKGNPNPRSYYKCTSTGCTVRKHVERASHDLKSVITTYEGKHNHDVPAARNSSHVNSQPQTQQIHRSEMHNTTMGARFDYGLHQHQHQHQPSHAHAHGYGYGAGLGQAAMPGFGPGNQGKFPPVHQFLGQMGMMLPKGEPKVESVSDPGLNLANANNNLYHNQMINRLPLGPHM